MKLCVVIHSAILFLITSLSRKFPDAIVRLVNHEWTPEIRTVFDDVTGKLFYPHPFPR